MKFRRNKKSFMSNRWDADAEYKKKENPILPILLFILGVLGVIEFIRNFLNQ